VISSSWRFLGLAVAFLVGCSPDSGVAGPLRLEMAPAGRDTRVLLLSAPGVKLNARLKPALELTDGTILRFDSPHLTPDSAYFAEPPSALVHGHPTSIHGKLRASVCDAGERVCRTIMLDL
jgi:hypothetical protein